MKNKIKIIKRSALREFARSYRMPFNATILLVLIIVSMLFFRVRDQVAVAGILSNNHTPGQTYADLLSKDKVDGLQPNDVTNDDAHKQTEVTTTSSTTTPFTISPSGGSSGDGSETPPPGETPPPDDGGTTPPPPPPAEPFTAEINDFRYGGASPVECGNTTPPPPTGDPSDSTCFRKHYFGAVIYALNGPGTVNYVWQSSNSLANEGGGFGAPSGETYTPLHKQIAIPCSQPGPLTLKLILTAPNPDESNTITIDHRC